MKAWTRTLALVICLATAGTAFAEKELVMLSDGVSGMGEIVSTTEDSIKVKFAVEGNAAEAVLQASRLDPHNFYTLRRKHMESTVENHVKLAVWCAQEGLFKRAKFQMDRARDIDPEIDTKLKDKPEIMAGIAQRLLDSAKAAYKKGDLELAHELASLLATRFAETEQGEFAAGVLDQLEAKIDEKAATKVAAREKKIQDAADDDAKQAAATRHKAISAIEKEQTSGRKKNRVGLRANNRSTGKRQFEAAVTDFKRALQLVKSARKANADDAELGTMLDGLEGELKSDCVGAYVNAGNVELWRSNYKGAQDYGKKALEVDPESQAAKTFLNRVMTYFHMRDDGWGRRGGGRR